MTPATAAAVIKMCNRIWKACPWAAPPLHGSGFTKEDVVPDLFTEYFGGASFFKGPKGGEA